MRKKVLPLLLSLFVLFCFAKGFPLDTAPNFWTKGTLPANHYVNIRAISTPYGEGVSVNTTGYPGAFDLYYDFFAYYSEVLVVPPTGTVMVSGYFCYNDITPHLDRKYLAAYLLLPDVSGYIRNETRILNYAEGHYPGSWYFRSILLSGLTPGQEYRLAFGRGDLCDIDRKLEANWAAIEVTSSRILEVPNNYATIQQAITSASNGDIIKVAPGTYYENLVVEKDNLKILGENSSTTVIDSSKGNVPSSPGVNITGKHIVLSGFTVRNCPFAEGIRVLGKDVTVLESKVANSSIGINIFADNSRIMKNNICNNSYGVQMQSNVKNCTLYYNNFSNNTHHVNQASPQDTNTWDNGYAGNFWSDYTDPDRNGDGIGDSPYTINPSNIDHYPLMKPYLCGDVNHDGKVDIQDIARVSGAYGSYPGHQKWNPHADFNEDRRIDIADLARASANYGRYRL